MSDKTETIRLVLGKTTGYVHGSQESWGSWVSLRLSSGDAGLDGIEMGLSLSVPHAVALGAALLLAAKRAGWVEPVAEAAVEEPPIHDGAQSVIPFPLVEHLQKMLEKAKQDHDYGAAIHSPRVGVYSGRIDALEDVLRLITGSITRDSDVEPVAEAAVAELADA